MRVLLSVRARISCSRLRGFDPAGVSAWPHHPTNNRVDALGLLLRGGREVVRGRGRHAIGLQPNAEFGIGPTEQVRLVLGQRIRPIRPLRSWLVNPFDDHPDEAGRGGWLSPHNHGLSVGSLTTVFRLPWEPRKEASVSVGASSRDEECTPLPPLAPERWGRSTPGAGV